MNAPDKELNWPTLASSTWPGKVEWTSVTLAGLETEVSATLSMSGGHSAAAVSLVCALFTFSPTRQDIPFLSPAMMPSATQVGQICFTRRENGWLLPCYVYYIFVNEWIGS